MAAESNKVGELATGVLPRPLPIACYVIWSFEHNAWWGPDRRGYVKMLRVAGLYTATEAGQIVTNSIMGDEVALHISTARFRGAPTVTSLWEGTDESGPGE